jgi:hypothetical protein
MLDFNFSTILFIRRACKDDDRIENWKANLKGRILFHGFIFCTKNSKTKIATWTDIQPLTSLVL